MKETITTSKGNKVSFSNSNTYVDRSTIFFNTPSSWAKTNMYYIEMFGHFVCGEDYMVERDGFRSYLLIRTINGSGTIETNLGKSICTVGDYTLIDCNNHHRYFANDYWEFEWFHFNGSASDVLAALFLADGKNSVTAIGTDTLSHMFHRLVLENRNETIIQEVDISSAIHSILAILIETKNSKKRYQSGHKNYIDDSIRYIEQNYSKNISIDEIADKISYSKSGFCHEFKKATGFSPYDYIISKRINMAKKMLKETEDSIESISVNVGFNSESNFIKTFKSKTGMTPKSFRSTHVN